MLSPLPLPLVTYTASPWNVPQVDVGLKLTSTLLDDVLRLGLRSPNHSLKAQHLLSRGIEVLVSIQHYLQNGENGEKNLLETLQTLNDLQATENVLEESIVILHEDVKEAESPPTDRAVMSSWHLNRNAFTAKLDVLAKTGPSEKDKGRWRAVMKDVVRADDLSFATRLSEDVEKHCQDAEAKEAVKSIVESLDKAPTQADEEKTRTDSILGIMCLADKETRTKGAGLDSVVRVVTDMAKELKKDQKGDWKSISDRLHDLPVCRKVEKPLLIHEGTYTIPAVIEDAQAEVLSAGASIGETVPLDISDSAVQNQELIAKAKKYVERVEKAMAEATRNLEALSKKKSFAQVIGKKTHHQISYAAMHLFGNIAMALTPAVELPGLTEPIKLVTASVSKFINALTAFGEGPGERWKSTLLSSLKNTAALLDGFRGEEKTHVGEAEGEEAEDKTHVGDAKAAEDAKAEDAKDEDAKDAKGEDAEDAKDEDAKGDEEDEEV